MNTVIEIVQTADERLKDAFSLASAGRYEWAFYSAGYAVELMFKARIALILDIPDLFAPTFSDKELVKPYKIHNLERLAYYSGLHRKIVQESLSDPQFTQAWTDVRVWNEQKRYLVQGEIQPLFCNNYLQQVQYIAQWIKKHV